MTGRPLTPSPRRVEPPARRRARLLRYRAVFAERYGKGPEQLNECKEHLR